jgi:DNA-binding LytR/AlgR family response regulator
MNKPKILLDFPAVNLEYLTADSNYTSRYFNEGSKLISGDSLNGLFDERHFIRIDRVNLINQNFISGIKRKAKGDFICLRNSQEILILRRKHQEVRNALPIFLKINKNE